jgi:polar amino acid transport system substrate-binding protein
MQGNKMRRLLFVTLAGVALAAAGCGSSSSSSSSSCKPAHQFSTLQQGTLSVSAYSALPNFEPGKNGGPPTGIDGDILAYVAKKECMKLNVQIENTAAVIPAVQSNRTDVAAGGWYITPERKKVVDFTIPYVTAPAIFASKKGYNQVDQIKGKTLATTQGFLWVSRLQKLYGANHVKLYQTPDAAMQDLALGRVDAVMDSLEEGGQLAKQTHNSGIQVKIIKASSELSDTTHPGLIGFPYTQGNSALGAALDADIKQLQDSGQIKKILQKYGVDPAAGDT